MLTVGGIYPLFAVTSWLLHLLSDYVTAAIINFILPLLLLVSIVLLLLFRGGF